MACVGYHGSRDAWSRFLEAVQSSPPCADSGQEAKLLERAVRAYQRSGRTGAVDVPVDVHSMPCCGAVRTEKSCDQTGTVWRMTHATGGDGTQVVHDACGHGILLALESFGSGSAKTGEKL